MPDNEFGSLAERLLRAGVAPRHVRRLLDELTTHYALLVEEETGRGQALEAARSVARARLGTDDVIVARASEQAMLRSWGARWPLACAIAPLLGLAGSALILMAALVAVFSAVAPPGEPASWLRRGTTLIGWALMYGLPLVWAYLLARYSVSRRLGWRWPLTGLTLAAAAGAATNFSVIWAGPGVRGPGRLERRCRLARGPGVELRNALARYARIRRGALRAAQHADQAAHDSLISAPPPSPRA